MYKAKDSVYQLRISIAYWSIPLIIVVGYTINVSGTLQVWTGAWAVCYVEDSIQDDTTLTQAIVFYATLALMTLTLMSNVSNVGELRGLLVRIPVMLNKLVAAEKHVNNEMSNYSKQCTLSGAYFGLTLHSLCLTVLPHCRWVNYHQGVGRGSRRRSADTPIECHH